MSKGIIGPPIILPGKYKALAALTAGFRDDALNIRIDQKDMSGIWCLESPIAMVAGEARVVTITYLGQAGVTSPTATAYKGTTDVTSTVFPGSDALSSSNVATANRSIVTLKKMGGLVGGETYVFCITSTIGGNTDIRKFELAVEKTTTRQTGAGGAIWCVESPVVMVAGESRAFTVTYIGQTSVTVSVMANNAVKVYKGTTDVTTTVMPTGEPAASGNVLTLPAATGLVGGETYVVVATATVGGNTDIRKFEIVALKATDVQ